MRLYGTDNNYNFWWSGAPDNFHPNTLWNITPKGQAAPTTGYYKRDYIEKIKGVKFNNLQFRREAQNV